MKKIWKKTEGFTLVELIVVIAILGILAGVGTVGYSGYVKKANMAADQTLIASLRNAAEVGVLNHYSHAFGGPVVVKVGANEDAVVVSAAEDADVKAIDESLVVRMMQAVFGENWDEVCKLSYNGWTVDATDVVASYEESSVNGKEDQLLNTASELSDAFGKFMSNPGKNKPKAITDLMKKYGYDPNDSEAFANAAVLTFASDISGNESTKNSIAAELSVLSAANLPNISKIYAKHYGGESATDIMSLTGEAQNMAALATTATLYAFATEFSYYAKDNGDEYGMEVLDTLNGQLSDNAGTWSDMKIMQEVTNAFGAIYTKYASNLYVDYMGEGGQAAKDANALMGLMGGVASSTDALAENMGTSDCFKNAGSLVHGYLAAGKFLNEEYPAGVIINADGSVATYLGGIG